MGLCQTQQNIDINLFINNGDNKINKRYSIEKNQITKKNMNQIIKKAYINNVQFNNTKNVINNESKLKNKKPRNNIPIKFKDKKGRNKLIISRIETNKLHMSYTGERIPLDNTRSNSIDNKTCHENILNNISKDNNSTDRDNTSFNTKNTESINIKRKIIKDEDDTENLLSNLNEQIENKKDNNNNSLILSFNDFDINNNKEEIQLYYLSEFNFNSDNKYSQDKDFDNLLQSQIYNNKVNFTNLILSLPERKWYSELIELSDKFKFKRMNKNLDDNFLIEYLNNIIKIYNHFNHLVWALSYYYFSSLFFKKNFWFKNSKINLPHYKSLEYIKGFEWKGLHIKVLTHDQAKKIIREIKSLKYTFFEFLSLFNNNYNDINLLSNEIVFPLMSYAYFGGVFLFASVEIKKLCFDMNYLNSNLMKNEINNKLVRYRRSTLRKTIEKNDKNEYNDCTIDNSDDNFSFDEKLLNEEINISNYSKDDLKNTKILKKIKEKNLLKIFDEYNDENKIGRKYKFLLKNSYDLIPDLFKEDDNEIYKKLNILNCVDIKNEFKEPRYVNLTKVNNLDKNNEMNIISKLIRIKASKENIEIYKNEIDEIKFKILYENNKKGNKINQQITKFFVQFPLIQNYELSRLLTTEYLNVGNLNGILNKYYKENTQEIPDRNIILYRTSFKTKLKLAIINENIFPKSNEEYIDYVKLFSKEISGAEIKNIDKLLSFFEKYGFNKKFLPFCLEYISNESIRNIIQIYIYVTIIKKFYNYREGQSLLMKLALFERNKDDTIINSSESTKNNNIIEIQKNFFLNIIKLIIIPGEYLKEENNLKEPFSKIFFENISFFIFLRILKIKNFEKYINFKSSLAQLNVKQILENFNETCRKNPFLFIDSLERICNIRLNPFVKYKSSIDFNNMKYLKKDDIVIFIPEIKSFIEVKSISSFIFHNLLKNNKDIEDNNSILSKIDFNFFYPELNFENPINYINNKISFNENCYYIKNEDIIKVFCDMLEQIFNGVMISYNGDKELILAKSYIYLILNYFFCENDITKAKEIMIKIKNILSTQNSFSLSQISIIYLLEGFLFIDDLQKTEENYAKALFFFLLNEGDIIMNKNNKINPILIFPIFQLKKIIKLYKNDYLNEYLNEMISILKNKLKNYNEIIKILETGISDKNINKSFIENNYIKYFLSESIIGYFFSKDNLIFNEDIFSFYKIKLKEIIKKPINYITEYLFEHISFKKSAPSNIVIYFGQLNNKISKPVILYNLLSKKINKIFAGYESNFVIDQNNIIYSWGNNSHSQLGIKPDIKNLYINTPVKINIRDLEDKEYIINIICAEKFTFFLSNKNRVYVSGIFFEKKYNEIQRINFIFEKEKIIQISTGNNFCLFLTSWGNVYKIDENINKVTNLNNIHKIFCGYEHCFAIAKNNIIFCWGNNDKGQLGLNTNSNKILLPTKLVLNNEFDIDNIFCGKDFTIFCNNKKQILVCGNNDEGQLGININKSNNNYYLKPFLNELFFNLNIIKISCGENFCVAIIKDIITNMINIWAWGSNNNGQIGFNSDIKNIRPKFIPSLLEYINHTPVDICCGKNHCLILLKKNDEINIDNDKILNQMISKYNKF